MVLPVPLNDRAKEEDMVKVESPLLLPLASAGAAKGEEGVPGPFDLGLL